MTLVRAYVALGLVTACGAPATIPEVLQTDSAGVRVTESTASAVRTLNWTVSDTPMLRLPSVGLGYELFRVGAIRPLGSDRFVLSNSGAQELLVFTLSGELVRRFGGPGEGPGEFTGLETVFVSSLSTLVAADFPQQRLTHFDSVGAVIRSVRLNPGVDFTYVFMRAQLGGDRFMGRMAIAPVQPESVPGLVEMPLDIALIESDGRVGAPITVGATEFFLYEADGRLAPIPYPLRTVWTFAGYEGRLYGSSSRELGVREFDVNGMVLRVIRRGDRPAPTDDQEWDRILTEELGRFDQQRAATLRRTYHEMPRAESWPLSDGLVIDADGNAWVKHYPMPGALSQIWSVFDLKSSELVTEVVLPMGLTVHAISNDMLFGTRESELGEESVDIYALNR